MILTIDAQLATCWFNQPAGQLATVFDLFVCFAHS